MQRYRLERIMTPEEVVAAISVVEGVADMVLPLVGGPEWVPVMTAAGELSKKLATLLMTHAQQSALQAAKAAVDIEVDAAEVVKFPHG
jgi:hypothetical protein